MVLMASCCLFIRLRDVERVHADAARLRAIAEESALPTCIAWADLYLGWALAEGGAVDEGLASMRRGLAAYLATDQRTGHPGYLAWIAAAQLRGNDPAAALDTLADAATALPEELVDVSAIWRIRGEALEADPTLAGSDETAVGCYEHAIAAARQFCSVMLELEAATQLARLLRREAIRAPLAGWWSRCRTDRGRRRDPRCARGALRRARRLRRTGGERIGLHHRGRRDGSGAAVVPRSGRASPSRDDGDAAARGFRPGRALDDRAREPRGQDAGRRPRRATDLTADLRQCSTHARSRRLRRHGAHDGLRRARARVRVPGPERCPRNWANFDAYQGDPLFSLYSPQMRANSHRFQEFLETAAIRGWAGKSVKDYFATGAGYGSPQDQQDWIDYFLWPYLSIINGYGAALMDQTLVGDLIPFFMSLPDVDTPLGSFTQPGRGWQRFTNGAQSWVAAMATIAHGLDRSSTVLLGCRVTQINTPQSGDTRPEVVWVDGDGTQHSERFDKVVSTLDMQTNASLLQPTPLAGVYESHIDPSLWSLQPGACYIHTDPYVLSPRLRTHGQTGFERETLQFTAYYAPQVAYPYYDLYKTYTRTCRRTSWTIPPPPASTTRCTATSLSRGSTPCRTRTRCSTRRPGSTRSSRPRSRRPRRSRYTEPKPRG